ncbi:LOB domain-containing protein [Striga asiatica]|uniref:LOB domain-containing protein n=1 Tax=Striga asiatica TaxID=4170 RepID=A0A5A7R1A0_STRAF|nr:LOB domain-containing protein [Striga asiatica]
MPGLEMTLKSGSGQACAACKHQRRRCNPDCILAPFFPADQSRVFQNVHRLFGVKHVQNLLKNLGPHEQVMAVKSIKFHAAMREKYPVYGCLVEIQNLGYQIQVAEEELQVLLQQLVYYRQQQQQQRQAGGTNDYSYPSSQVQLGIINPSSHAGYFNCDRNLEEKEKNDVDSNLFIQQMRNYDNMNNGDSSVIVQSQTTTNMPVPVTVPQEEMHSFFDNIDETQSYIGCKEVYESSLESPFKDSKHSTELMPEKELKSAAAYFSLTSVH